MAKCITEELYNSLCDKKTKFGVGLDECIQTGVDNPGHPFIMTVGAVAGDEESYDLFAPLFDKIIDSRHGGYGPDRAHKTDLNPDHLVGGDNLDPNYVLSSRVRTGRSIRGYRLPPSNDRAERRQVEKILSEALSSLDGPFKGTYYPLAGMSEETQDKLIDDHFLFDKPVSPLLLASRMARDWPESRGIWHNEEKNFLVWVNEEDHLRIISMQMGGDLGEVYRRWVSAVNSIEKLVKFSHHDRLGFLTFCPTNLGTTVRASVHIKVPKLAKDYSTVEQLVSTPSL
jgi:creatine kinase